MAADFWTVRHLTTQADEGARTLLLHEAVAAVRARGCTFFRASYPLILVDRVYVEGWIERPDDQGPCDHYNFDPTRQI